MVSVSLACFKWGRQQSQKHLELHFCRSRLLRAVSQTPTHTMASLTQGKTTTNQYEGKYVIAEHFLPRPP